MREADKRVERIKKLFGKNIFSNLSFLQLYFFRWNIPDFIAHIFSQYVPILAFILFIILFIFRAVAKVLPMPDRSIGKPFRRRCLKLWTLIHPMLLIITYVCLIQRVKVLHLKTADQYCSCTNKRWKSHICSRARRCWRGGHRLAENTFSAGSRET